MDYEEIFRSESEYLKAADLKGREWVVAIATIKAVTLSGKRKIVITFQNAKKALICNKTNAKRIASIHGRDIDDWIGREITLFPTEVDFQGDMVPAIRVKNPTYVPEQSAAAPQQMVRQPQQAQSIAGNGPVSTATPPAPGNPGKGQKFDEQLGDEIPF